MIVRPGALHLLVACGSAVVISLMSYPAGYGATDSYNSSDGLSSTAGPMVRGQSGYWLVASDGAIFNFGDAGLYGSGRGPAPSERTVAMAATPDGMGYWIVSSAGAVSSFGDAGSYGSAGGQSPEHPVVAIAATPDGMGYWLVSSDGVVSGFGDARLYGSSRGPAPSEQTASMAATPDGKGYWLVSSDGLVSGFGDARLYGSVVGLPPRDSVVAMAATPDAKGYWLVSSDGIVSGFGDAGAYGPVGGLVPSGQAVVGMTPYPDRSSVGRTRAGGSPSSGAAGGTGQVSLSLGPVGNATSPTWSGYAASNGTYVGVGGTFTVPTVAFPMAGSTICEWVGVDGYTDRSVLQAGVDELLGSRGQVMYQPWWEVFPAPQVPISTVTISAGDAVTVKIDRVSNHEWALSLTDDTNGENYKTSSSYSGPASSAEWIVEADTPDYGTTAADILTPFAPHVSFTRLGAMETQTGAAPAISRIVMVHDGGAVSNPSLLSPQGDFNVAYGSAVPANATAG